MPASDPTPAEPLRCLSCWYVVDEAHRSGPIPDGLLCPECATPVTEVSSRLAVIRSAMIDESQRPAYVGFAIMAVGVLAYAALAAWATWSFQETSWVLATGGLVIAAYAATTILIVPWRGSRLRAVNPSIERRLLATLWLRHVAWFASPWLLPLAGLLVLVPIMLLTSFLIPNVELMETINFGCGMIVFFGGCCAVLAMFMEWADRWNKHLDASYVSATDFRAWVGIIAFLTFLASIVVGIAGTILAVNVLSEVSMRLGR